MDDGALESSSEEGSSLDEPSWVSWFCMLRNHEFFCEVDPAFVQDRFNLYGLKEVVGPLYGEAMTMILGYAPTGAHRAPRARPPPAAAWPEWCQVLAPATGSAHAAGPCVADICRRRGGGPAGAACCSATPCACPPRPHPH
jgi:hypothetical protein